MDHWRSAFRDFIKVTRLKKPAGALIPLCKCPKNTRNLVGLKSNELDALSASMSVVATMTQTLQSLGKSIPRYSSGTTLMIILSTYTQSSSQVFKIQLQGTARLPGSSTRRYKSIYIITGMVPRYPSNHQVTNLRCGNRSCIAVPTGHNTQYEGSKQRAGFKANEVEDDVTKACRILTCQCHLCCSR